MFTTSAIGSPIVASLVTPNVVVASTTPVATTTIETEIEVVVEKPEWTFETLLPILAKKYGQSEKLARAIIKCESDNKPSAVGYNRKKDGTIWSTDIGYWQINNYWNKKTAADRGFNIMKWEDNLEFGFIMLKERGTAPWNSSAYCWKG